MSVSAVRRSATFFALSLACACSGPAQPSSSDVGPARDSVRGAEAGALPVAGCDEDNPAVEGAETLDRALPDEVVAFERGSGWNCMHREWHNVRKLRILLGREADYSRAKGWVTPVDPAEGAPGNGLEFLAMHRVMLSELRARFPEHAELFKGWDAVPTDPADPDNPLPGGAMTPFEARMKGALGRLTDQLASFASDDDYGLYVETNLRPTPDVPWNLATDRSTGIHNYLHGRFNDPKSPIRMGNFARNIENRTFWKLHGWLDNRWSALRAAKGLADADDATYLGAMNGACAHMRLGPWDAAAGACAARDQQGHAGEGQGGEGGHGGDGHGEAGRAGEGQGGDGHGEAGHGGEGHGEAGHGGEGHGEAGHGGEGHGEAGRGGEGQGGEGQGGQAGQGQAGQAGAGI
jgi:hypothetical protein